MNRIEKLIEEMCPEGVEVVPMQGCCEYVSDKVKVSELDSFKYTGVDNLLSNKGGRTESRYPPKSGSFSHYQEGDVLLGNIRPYLRKIWMADDSGICGGDVLAVRAKKDWNNKIQARFLFHILASEDFFLFNIKNSRGTKMPRGDKKTIMKFPIPIPPLQIQKEIVNILDKFTQLEAELEAELEAREKQYEEVRRRLLDFESDTSNHPLGEMIREMCPEGVDTYKLNSICSKVKSVSWTEQPGKTFEYIDLSSVDIQSGRLGETRLVHEGDAPSRARQIVEKNDVLFATTRPTQMRLHLVTESSKYIASTGYSVIRGSSEEIDPKFIFFYLGTNRFYRYVENNQTLGNYPSISDSTVKDFGIHLPPLEIQKEIVRILENLDSLVNSVNEGIPAEIAARRKQYEYYRDKLLTFKELDAA